MNTDSRISYIHKKGKQLRLTEYNQNTEPKLFEIDEFIAQGTNCAAYIAKTYDGGSSIARPVILKEFFPVTNDENTIVRDKNGNLIISNENIESFSKAWELVKHNNEMHRQLQLDKPTASDVPYTISIYEGYNTYYLVSAYDGSLCYENVSFESQNIAELLYTIKYISLAVKKYHDNGYLHLDLKPNNILIKGGSSNSHNSETIDMITVEIFDFDTMQKITDVKKGIYLGSVSRGYAASEQKRESGCYKEIGPHTDIYAIGAILINRLSGSIDAADIYSDLDNEQESKKLEILERYIDKKNTNSQFIISLKLFLDNMLKIRPSERYSSIDEYLPFLDDLIEMSLNVNSQVNKWYAHSVSAQEAKLALSKLKGNSLCLLPSVKYDNYSYSYNDDQMDILLEKNDHLMLTGVSGSGKSTLLTNLWYDFTRGNYLLDETPLYISLGECGSFAFDKDGLLYVLIEKYFASSTSDIDKAQWINELKNSFNDNSSNGYLLIIDGFNEISEKKIKDVQSQVEELADYCGLHLILCAQSSILSESIEDKFTCAVTATITTPQKKQFILEKLSEIDNTPITNEKIIKESNDITNDRQLMRILNTPFLIKIYSEILSTLRETDFRMRSEYDLFSHYWTFNPRRKNDKYLHLDNTVHKAKIKTFIYEYLLPEIMFKIASKESMYITSKDLSDYIKRSIVNASKTSDYKDINKVIESSFQSNSIDSIKSILITNTGMFRELKGYDAFMVVHQKFRDFGANRYMDSNIEQSVNEEKISSAISQKILPKALMKNFVEYCIISHKEQNIYNQMSLCTDDDNLSDRQSVTKFIYNILIGYYLNGKNVLAKRHNKLKIDQLSHCGLDNYEIKMIGYDDYDKIKSKIGKSYEELDKEKEKKLIRWGIAAVIAVIIMIITAGRYIMTVDKLYMHFEYYESNSNNAGAIRVSDIYDEDDYKDVLLYKIETNIPVDIMDSNLNKFEKVGFSAELSIVNYDQYSISGDYLYYLKLSNFELDEDDDKTGFTNAYINIPENTIRHYFKKNELEKINILKDHIANDSEFIYVSEPNSYCINEGGTISYMLYHNYNQQIFGRNAEVCKIVQNSEKISNGRKETYWSITNTSIDADNIITEIISDNCIKITLKNIHEPVGEYRVCIKLPYYDYIEKKQRNISISNVPNFKIVENTQNEEPKESSISIAPPDDDTVKMCDSLEYTVFYSNVNNPVLTENDVQLYHFAADIEILEVDKNTKKVRLTNILGNNERDRVIFVFPNAENLENNNFTREYYTSPNFKIDEFFNCDKSYDDYYYNNIHVEIKNNVTINPKHYTTDYIAVFASNNEFESNLTENDIKAIGFTYKNVTIKKIEDYAIWEYTSNLDEYQYIHAYSIQFNNLNPTNINKTMYFVINRMVATDNEHGYSDYYKSNEFIIGNSHYYGAPSCEFVTPNIINPGDTVVYKINYSQADSIYYSYLFNEPEKYIILCNCTANIDVKSSGTNKKDNKYYEDYYVILSDIQSEFDDYTSCFARLKSGSALMYYNYESPAVSNMGTFYVSDTEQKETDTINPILEILPSSYTKPDCIHEGNYYTLPYIITENSYVADFSLDADKIILKGFDADISSRVHSYNYGKGFISFDNITVEEDLSQASITILEGAFTDSSGNKSNAAQYNDLIIRKYSDDYKPENVDTDITPPIVEYEFEENKDIYSDGDNIVFNLKFSDNEDSDSGVNKVSLTRGFAEYIFLYNFDGIVDVQYTNDPNIIKVIISDIKKNRAVSENPYIRVSKYCAYDYAANFCEGIDIPINFE